MLMLYKGQYGSASTKLRFWISLLIFCICIPKSKWSTSILSVLLALDVHRIITSLTCPTSSSARMLSSVYLSKTITWANWIEMISEFMYNQRDIVWKHDFQHRCQKFDLNLMILPWIRRSVIEMFIFWRCHCDEYVALVQQ